MIEIPHGDLIEQRRGGVDVLRVIAKDLERHEQSGAVKISAPDGTRVGWLLFRIGLPVMAFHHGVKATQGLEALLEIEQDGLNIENEVMLYEMGVSGLRQTMNGHSHSILHLERETEASSEGHWWSSVRLPSISWNREARPEDYQTYVFEPESLRRGPSRSSASGDQVLMQPGDVLFIDSPDPHPMMHLGIELAERGLPFLGLFGAPFGSTDVTRRLPIPSCHSLMGSHDQLHSLESADDVLKCLETFMWGNERSVVVINGLDRLGNALGDDAMLDVFRALVDGVRFNDHLLLCSTDLEVFSLPVRHGLLSEAQELQAATLNNWLNDTDGLFDHPILTVQDEDEARWIEAQLVHQLGATPNEEVAVASFSMEGGGLPPDETERQAAVEALAELVEDWPAVESVEPVPSHVKVPHNSEPSAWKPSIESPVRSGRFVSESTPIEPVVEHAVPVALPEPKSIASTTSDVKPALRQPQKMVRRKPKPQFPEITNGLTVGRSHALSGNPQSLPDWPERNSSPTRFLNEQLDPYQSRLEQAEKRQAIRRPMREQTALKDNVSASASFSEPSLPGTVSVPTLPKTPSGEQIPLEGGVRPEDDLSTKPAREVASSEQHTPTIEEVYDRWNQWEDEQIGSTTALYSERGEKLKKFGEGEQ